MHGTQRGCLCNALKALICSPTAVFMTCLHACYSYVMITDNLGSPMDQVCVHVVDQANRNSWVSTMLYMHAHHYESMCVCSSDEGVNTMLKTNSTLSQPWHLSSLPQGCYQDATTSCKSCKVILVSRCMLFTI